MADTKRRQQTRGTCVFCGKDYAKSGISRHLASCDAREKAYQEAKKKKRKPQTLYHIMATCMYMPDYWLHFETPARTKLYDIDGFLRNIWLECCGHLSEFEIGAQRYTSSAGMFDDFMSLNEKGMDISLKNALKVGDEFTHIYDYGTSTELILKVVSEREDVPLSPAREPIHVMARNNPPKIMCQNCNEREATIVCTFCMYDPSSDGWVCEKCKTEHQCYKDEGDDYMFLPVVNSPRVGQCGYTGDVEW